MSDLALLSFAGQGHLRTATRNQDAVGVWSHRYPEHDRPRFAGSAGTVADLDPAASVLHGDGSAAVTNFDAFAVSDGHGSVKYDRSDRGSAIAVNVMLGAAGRAATRLSEKSSGGLTEWLRHEIPRRLVQQWRVQVLDDAAALGDAIGTDPEAIASTIDRYGATLIGGLMCEAGTVFWQLGDGDLVVVGADGAVEMPTESTEAQLGPATDSLCQEQAELLFRVSIDLDGYDPTSMIFASTDGVANSFVDDAGFAQFVTSVAERSRDDRRANLVHMLERWLARCSSFSGDDVTAAVRFPSKLS